MTKRKKKADLIKIKPCPFALDTKGDMALQVTSFAEDKYQVICSDCGTIGPVGDTPEEALEKWNTRLVVILSEEAYNIAVESMEKDNGDKKTNK